jgi:dihydrofolate reductase
MGRIVAFNHVSADGYFAAPDGDLSWVVPEDAVASSAMEGMPESDTILFGRRTYEIFESYWPHALDDSDTAEDPHSPGRRSAEVREMAVWINEARKVVFSRTRSSYSWQNTVAFGELDPREVEGLKRASSKDMMLFGSGSIASQLTRHGLIDEYQFAVSPILLGDGQTMLNGLPVSARLKLTEAKAFDSGVVLQRYVRAE